MNRTAARPMTAPEPRSAAKARLAAAGAFFIVGVGMSTWFTEIARFSGQLSLTPGILAIALVAPTIGALASMQIVGSLTARFSSRDVIRLASMLLPVSLLGIAFVDNVWQAVAVLLVFGALDGALDVAINAQGVEVERALGRPVLNSLHGAWGVGAILGGAMTSAVIALGVSLAWHLVLITVLLVPLGWICGRHLIAAAEQPTAHQRATPDPARRRGFAAWRASWTVRVVILGAVGAAGMLAEGSISNWIGVYLSDHKAATGALAAAGYTIFTLTETLARFAGDRVNERIGPVLLMRAGAAVFVAGMIVILLSPNVWLSLVGLVLAGIGISPINPLAFSAVGHGASDDGSDGSGGRAIGHFTTLSYGGLLGGPAIIGGIAEVVGLPLALASTLVAVALIVVAAPVAGRTSRMRVDAATADQVAPATQEVSS